MNTVLDKCLYNRFIVNIREMVINLNVPVPTLYYIHNNQDTRNTITVS